MTATIPPTSTSSRRRTGEKSRTARRRATERNRIEDASVDKGMPRSPGSDPNRSRRPRTGATTPPRGTAAAGTRRAAASAKAASTKTASAKAAGAPGARGNRAAPPAKGRTREADPGTKGGEKVRTGVKHAGKARDALGARRAKAVPGAKRVQEVREVPGVRGAEKGHADADRSGKALAPRARTPFVLLIVGLLAGALVSLLLLNTVLAQDAFTLSELQRGNHQLGERKQALQEEVDRESSPEGLHARARSLGMQDAPRPAFIDARTGRVIEGGARPPGVPDSAVAAAGATAVTGVPGAIVPPPAARTNGGAR